MDTEDTRKATLNALLKETLLLMEENERLGEELDQIGDRIYAHVTAEEEGRVAELEPEWAARAVAVRAKVDTVVAQVRAVMTDDEIADWDQRRTA